MEKAFEKVKRNLAEHLLKIDLEKLSMMDLNGYVNMVVMLDPVYQEKEDMAAKLAEIFARSSGICVPPVPSAPIKEV